jgi:phage terminase large subunit GpA-like protein
LLARVEDYIDIKDLKVPNEVLMLVASVDVQGGRSGKDPRLEVKVMGFGLDEEAWVIYHNKIIGDPAQKEVWRKLDEFWQMRWYRQDGVELEIVRKFIDAGYLFSTVTEYCRGRSSEGIWAIKGAKSHDAPSIPRHFTPLKGGAKFLSIGTQNIKRELFARLNNIKIFGPRFIHFPRALCGSSYFRQLTSEVAVTKTNGYISYTVYEPEDKHQDNEALDLMVYCFAAMKHAMPNFPIIKKVLDKQIKIVKVSRSSDYAETVQQETVSERRGRSLRRGDRTNHNISNWRYS